MWLLLVRLFTALFISSLTIPLANCRSKKQTLDKTQIRNAKSAELLKYMKLDVNPCENFYEYACGNWSQYYKPEQNEYISVHNLLKDEVMKKLENILNNPSFARDSAAAAKTYNFYKSCLDMDRTSATQRDFLLNFLREHGGLQILPVTNWHSTFNWELEIAKLRVNYGLDILIGLEINKNVHTGRGNSIFLGEPKSTLIPPELCSAIASLEADLKDEAYENIQQEIAANMRSWFDLKQSDAIRFAADIVVFEFQLCKKMRSDHTWRENDVTPNDEEFRQTRRIKGQSRLHGNRDNLHLYPRQSVQYWTQRYENVIDFKLYLNTIFDKPINDQVYMANEAYFQQLTRVIKMSSGPTIANYILYRALEEITFPNPDNAWKRPRYCVEFTLRYFPKVVGSHLQRFYRENTKDDIDFIFREIKTVLSESVRADWMDENTKNAALQRLSPFRVRFPSYDNLELITQPIERLNFWQKLQLVMRHNAKVYLDRLYNVDMNSMSDNIEASDVTVKLMPTDSEIVIGWGVLQEPLYNYFYPNALKFSVLGQQISRELAIAFDAQGWQQSSLSTNRFDEYATEGFRNQSECFRAQFSNYLYNSPDVFRNASKTQELMADSSGLNIAFKAYLKWLESIDPIEIAILSQETLPEVNFSNTQLFFIHFAQTRCMSKIDEESPPDFLPLVKHTMERFQVNGPLANNEEFAREFNCIRGTEMNPDDKCILFT